MEITTFFCDECNDHKKKRVASFCSSPSGDGVYLCAECLNNARRELMVTDALNQTPTATEPTKDV
jgi:uncharacterized protein YlaI